ncbi:MAG TPA: formyltransferase family protein [Rhodospirillales bacterium]
MPEEVVLLTGEVEGPHFRAILQSVNRSLIVHHAETLEALAAICGAPTQGGGLRRLVAFSTGVVVPPAILDGLRTPAYNFHPGPPTYPGSHAASFAVYEGAERFGATVHEMTAQVDSGPIVAVEWFEMPANVRFMDLELATYKVLLKLFADLAPTLATSDAPLPRIDVNWSGRRRTKAEFEKMKVLEADMDEAEIRLRYRAFG